MGSNNTENSQNMALRGEMNICITGAGNSIIKRKALRKNKYTCRKYGNVYQIHHLILRVFSNFSENEY